MGKGLSVRDIVTTGIFSALYIIFMFTGGIFFAPNPVLTFLTPLAIALVTGPVYLLLVARTCKASAITLFGAVMGLVLFATGMYWAWALASLVFGFLADRLAGIGGYHNKVLNILSFLLYSLNSTVPYTMLLIDKEGFASYLIGKGTDPAYMDTMLATFKTWMIPGIAAGTLICAGISALLGCRLLKKQFERAGITS